MHNIKRTKILDFEKKLNNNLNKLNICTKNKCNDVIKSFNKDNDAIKKLKKAEKPKDLINNKKYMKVLKCQINNCKKLFIQNLKNSINTWKIQMKYLKIKFSKKQLQIIDEIKNLLKKKNIDLNDFAKIELLQKNFK